MKHIFFKFIFAFCLLLPAPGIFAQVSSGGTPPSFNYTVPEDIPSVATKSINVTALLAEDEADKTQGLPFRFGYGFDVAYDLDNSGIWDTLPDGSLLWRLEIVSSGAYSINLVYSHFNIPEGAEFFVYSADKSYLIGAFTSANNNEFGTFATAPVKGDRCILEYREPIGAAFPGDIAIEKIVHGYKDIFSFDVTKDLLDFGESGACNVNINCPLGANWQDEKRAVAMILTSSGTRICSGTLINNIRQDLTPYFLTANHCLGNPENWIFMFNYESPTCGNFDGPTYMTTFGSVLRATDTYSDFALLELLENPPDSYNVFYSGWSAAGEISDSVTCIHHPSGDIKKISIEYDSISTTAYISNDTTSGDQYLRVGDWDVGTTEGGSSGSALFNKDHKIIGQLRGGYAACGNDSPDWFGSLAISWDYGATSSTRLKDWLDPDNSGLLEVAGRYVSGLTILHEPLENTLDSINDYTLLCTILSQSAPVAESLLVWYEIGSSWYNSQLTETGNPNEYTGAIPAQTPGTVINYYLFARNIDGDRDSTNTYTFEIIDYDFVQEPADSTGSAYHGTPVWYNMHLINNGNYTDDYSLGVSVGNWPAEIYDAAGELIITNSGSVVVGDTFDFKVKISIPPSAAMNDVDTTLMTATSVNKPSLADTSLLETVSDGDPDGFPLFEPFLTQDINTQTWVYSLNVDISASAPAPPSPPFAVRLNGAEDILTSRTINLASQTDIILSFYYQRGGNQDPPDSEDLLIIEYRNSGDVWVGLDTLTGDGPTMTYFRELNLGLPPDASHDQFQVRFIAMGGCEDCDNWFLDNISVDYAPDITTTPASFDITLNQSSTTDDELVIVNNGLGMLNYDIFVTPNFNKSTLFTQLLQEGKVAPARRKYPDGFEKYVDVKGVDDTREGFEVTTNAGGPDLYGYTWIDSDETGGPTFNWKDISTTGTDIVSQLGDDDYYGPIALGFEFPYYGQNYQQLYVGSNGIIGFAAAGMDSRFRTSLPSSSTPNNIIAWFWDDMNPDEIGFNPHVYVDTTGDSCIIMFENYPRYNALATGIITAEVILTPDGIITVQYLEIGPSLNISNNAIGTENSDGTDGLEVAYLTSYVHNDLALTFYPPYQWLSLDKNAGSVEPGMSDTLAINFTSGGLDPGTYTNNINIYNNDPDNDPYVVEAVLNVTGEPPFVCGDANCSGGDPDISDIVRIIDYLYISHNPLCNPLAADVDKSGGEPDISDITKIIAFLYLDGADLVCNYY